MKTSPFLVALQDLTRHQTPWKQEVLVKAPLLALVARLDLMHISTRDTDHLMAMTVPLRLLLTAITVFSLVDNRKWGQTVSKAVMAMQASVVRDVLKLELS